MHGRVECDARAWMRARRSGVAGARVTAARHGKAVFTEGGKCWSCGRGAGGRPQDSAPLAGWGSGARAPCGICCVKSSGCWLPERTNTRTNIERTTVGVGMECRRHARAVEASCVRLRSAECGVRSAECCPLPESKAPRSPPARYTRMHSEVCGGEGERPACGTRCGFGYIGRGR